jgi:hypothetical protein
MRVQVETVTALSVVALALGSASQAGSAAQDPGRLSGVTQITYGCPGPQREGETCERWSSFAQAQFRVAKLNSAAAVRTVTSDARGRFTLALAPGLYRLTPLRQAHTTGGTAVTVTVRAGATAWARVRFQGFPRML